MTPCPEKSTSLRAQPVVLRMAKLVTPVTGFRVYVRASHAARCTFSSQRSLFYAGSSGVCAFTHSLTHSLTAFPERVAAP